MSVVHPVNNDLIENTIKIRTDYRLKLPDAIIAATAITYGMTLLSRNISDFSKIKEMSVIDAHNL